MRNVPTDKKKYRVRDMVTGLFQLDGVLKVPHHSEVRWSNKGKTWASLEDLTGHFKLLKEYNIPVSPLWEVVEVTAGRDPQVLDAYPAASVFS